MRLDGGSSQGIGQAIAIRLSLEGAQVVIHYRSHPEGAEETLEKVKATGGACHMSGCPDSGFSGQADLGVMDDIRHLIEDGIRHFGRLDILVNNAGLERHAPFWEVTEKDYDQVMDVNLKGAFFAAQSMVRHLMETK